MGKSFQFDEMVLRSLAAGVDQLSRRVKVTMGPCGRNVVMRGGASGIAFSREGSIVARGVFLPDQYEDMGAQLVKEVAFKSGERVGGGTTTSIVLADAIFKAGVRGVMAGADPMELKRGIEKGVDVLIAGLERLAEKVDSGEVIEKIATIAADNDDEVGRQIAKVREKVGSEGRVICVEGKGRECEIEVVEGLQLSHGYSSPYFVTNKEEMTAELKGARVLVADRKLSDGNELIPLLEKVYEAGPFPLLVIARDVSDEALSTLVVNQLKGGLTICPVRCALEGEKGRALLEDIAIFCGAQLLQGDGDKKVEEIELDDLGQVENVSAGREETVIAGGGGSEESIQQRRKEIRDAIQRARSAEEEVWQEERLARLAGAIGRVHVGAVSQSVMEEKKRRFENGLRAIEGAIAEGMVPGGGVALIRVRALLDGVGVESEGERWGLKALQEACLVPLHTIAENCGEDGSVVVDRVAKESGSYGFDGLTGTFGDLTEKGVIDPVLHTKMSLIHGASVASLLLTTGAIVVNSQNKSV